MTELEEDLLAIRLQIVQYFTALYGESFTYRAPETFPNALERWMLLVASGAIKSAARQMLEIEEMIRRDRG